jgi:hypothetical protein
MKQYTGFVGQKFNEDGSVRGFPGNTVISKISPDMPIYAGLVETQRRLKALDSAGKYAFLPPSSLHMTVIEGVCDQVRTPEKWSSKLALDMPLPDVNRFVSDCYARLSPPESLSMRIARTYFGRLLLVILEPADALTAKSLADFRDQFARESGIRFPNHDDYTFHISLAYLLINMRADEESVFQAEQDEVLSDLSSRFPVLELRKPDLTSFENMFRFDNLC